MESTTRLILPDVAEALAGDPQAVLELTEELRPADLADLTFALPDHLALILVSALPVTEGARLLDELEHGRRLVLFEQLTTRDVARAADLAEEMSPDERADLIGELAPEIRAPLLAAMERTESQDVRQLLAYPDGTAGALMTTAFVTLGAELTVAAALEQVRRSAEDMETIYDAYAVAPNGTLLGAVSLRDLIVAKADRTIADIMDTSVAAVEDTLDQEEVARLIAKYDLTAAPVIDANRRVVGIITVDDVIDVVEEEATEDVQRLGGVQPLEASYFQTDLWTFVKKRALWLVVLFVGGLATGSAMRFYTSDAAIAAFVPLLWFLPLIISSGGNAGSQSASLMIRALAVGEVRPQDFVRVLSRELVIGVSLGLALSFVGVGRVLLWSDTRTFAMAATVSLSVISVVTIGALLGAGFPLLLRRLNIDPAVASTPFIASLSDVVGLVIYFEIARAFL